MSISNVDLERQLKTVTKTGKYVVGRKEVLHGLKGTKLLVWSAAAGVPPQMLSESKSLSIPSIRFEGNPIELGKACGIPYKVSVFAVKSAGEATLSQFETSKDYGPEQMKQSLSLTKIKAPGKNGEEGVSNPKRKKKAKEEKESKDGGAETKTERQRKKKRADANQEDVEEGAKKRSKKGSGKSTKKEPKGMKSDLESSKKESEEDASAEEQNED